MKKEICDDCGFLCASFIFREGRLLSAYNKLHTSSVPIRECPAKKLIAKGVPADLARKIVEKDEGLN